MKCALFALGLLVLSSAACARDRGAPSEVDTIGVAEICEPTVSPASATIAVGDSVRFTATFCGNPSIGWRSSDTTKAVVSQTGVARGIASGAVTIVARSLPDTTVNGAASLTIHSP